MQIKKYFSDLEILLIVYNICKAIEVLYYNKILHYDIKP